MIIGVVIDGLSNMQKESSASENATESRLGSDDVSLLHQYKNLIRQQDAKLQEVTTQIEKINKRNNELEVSLNEYNRFVSFCCDIFKNINVLCKE